MVILIAGASHTGKTVLSQRMLEKYKYPYLSIDLLKMGLIRSGNTRLTPEHDNELISYLWPIVKEIIKTAIENHQNLIVEGIYIPFDWRNDFNNMYLKEIQYCCLIMTERYIKNNLTAIKKYAKIIENRLDTLDITVEEMIKENIINLKMCKKYDYRYILIDEEYKLDIDL